MNKDCAYRSVDDPAVLLCRTCRIAEKMRQMEEDDEEQEDISDRPSLEIVASVTFDQANKRFMFDPNFFEIVGVDLDR